MLAAGSALGPVPTVTVAVAVVVVVRHGKLFFFDNYTVLIQIRTSGMADKRRRQTKYVSWIHVLFLLTLASLCVSRPLPLAN